MDVLINRLQNAGYGCKLVQRFVECLSVMPSPMILCCWPTRGMQYLRCEICDEFATEFGMKFISSKYVVMRLGDRYKVKCEPVMLAGCELQFVESLKYIGSSKCSIDNVRFKFYTSFNVIYSRDINIFYFYSSSKGAQSELVTLQLLKSYCFMLILCATEVCHCQSIL